jgi:hypothetical protein
VEVLVDDPAELVRVASMLTRLNSELQQIDLDQLTVDRIESLHRQVLDALEDNLHKDLIAELRRFVPALSQTSQSEADVRVAHLLLLGWIEGLFQGIQMTAFGNQIREQLVRQQQELQRRQRQPPPGSYL